MQEPGTAVPAGRVTAADVGQRVVVRHLLPDGRASDVLGRLDAFGGGVLVVRRADGEAMHIAADAVIAAKPVPPGPVRVRTARAGDASAIEGLRVAAWRSAYRGLVPDAYLDAMPVDGSRRVPRLTSPEPGVRELVGESAGEIVGWVAGGPARDADLPGAGEVYACYVAADWWGSGVGSRLLRRLADGLIADGRTVLALWVLPGNARAQRFYARHGFAPDGRVQRLDLGAPVVEERWVRRAGGT